MALEKFFRKGNKLAVFGSFIYLPGSAEDMDFTLFTKIGKNPFPCSPEYSEEIADFLISQFGKLSLKLDFTGRGDGIKKAPYNLTYLPKNDQRLDGYLLTGVFFPDKDFLNNHYRAVFGDNFLVKAWKRYSDYVRGFPLQEERLNKEHKDIALILKATERLADDRHPELKGLIEKYRIKYANLTKQHREERIGVVDYYRKASDMVPKFISAARPLILLG